MNTLFLVFVPLLPLAVALVCLLGRRQLSAVAGPLTAAGNFISLILLIFLGYRPETAAWVWLEFGRISVEIGFQVSGLTWFVALVVAGVAMLINLYAGSYMEAEDRPRFFVWMSFFSAGMLTLVLSSSLFLLFVAWEAVGLASWGLIGFHYRRQAARRAALKALLMTRLADMGLLLALVLVLTRLGTVSIDSFLQSVGTGSFSPTELTLLALLVLLAAAGKSAQLPLTAWLPDAMVGPSPVSALIHSATMVAAGVFLILRLYPLFEVAPGALAVILWTGAVTALAASLIAVTVFDLKRILAWSTVAQLGEMLFAIGLAGPLAAAFHLATHATFKSALFLAAGAVEHQTHALDLRRLGGLARSMPWSAGVFAVCGLALAGLPPLSGFWSEERILSRAWEAGPEAAVFLVFLVFLSGVYISRAGTAVFLDSKRGNPDQRSPTGDVHVGMWLPMACLGLAAAGAGLVLESRLAPVLPFAAVRHGLPWSWRGAGIAASAIGISLGATGTWRFGPRPALGPGPLLLERAIDRIALTPAAFVLRCASILPVPENGLDQLGRWAVRLATKLAAQDDRVERRSFDRFAGWLAKSSMQSATGVKWLETGGFGDGIDRFAHGFSEAGRRLRPIQNGKVYFYAMGLFVWVLLAAAGLVLIWL